MQSPLNKQFLTLLMIIEFLTYKKLIHKTLQKLKHNSNKATKKRTSFHLSAAIHWEMYDCELIYFYSPWNNQKNKRFSKGNLGYIIHLNLPNIRGKIWRWSLNDKPFSNYPRWLVRTDQTKLHWLRQSMYDLDDLERCTSISPETIQ